MNVGFCIQARMGSSRLPGKVLMPLGEKCLLQHVIDRVGMVAARKQVCVLTSVEPRDDAIEQWCSQNEVHCFRGSETNVLQRYCDACELFQYDHVVRLTADNPLIAPDALRDLLCKHLSGGYDYSSNKSEVGSFLPDGLGAEIFSRDALRRSLAGSSQPHHFEHVNEFILERPTEFSVFYDRGPLNTNCSMLRLTLDTQEDYIRISEIIGLLKSVPSDLSTERMIAFLLEMGLWTRQSE